MRSSSNIWETPTFASDASPTPTAPTCGRRRSTPNGRLSATRSRTSNRSCAGLERALAWALVVACGWRPPRPARLDPAAVVWPTHEPPRFAATGRVHIESSRGDVDGRIALRVDPPRRVWLEVRADALFGLVGERVVACLPGDGWLLIYEER